MKYYLKIKSKDTNRDYNEIFKQELENINKYDPIDEKDKFARDNIDDIAHKIIEQIKKVLKEIFKDEKTAAERYVVAKLKDLIHDIIGRIDYESNNAIFRTKNKTYQCYKRKRVKMNTILQQLDLED